MSSTPVSSSIVQELEELIRKIELQHETIGAMLRDCHALKTRFGEILDSMAHPSASTTSIITRLLAAQLQEINNFQTGNRNLLEFYQRMLERVRPAGSRPIVSRGPSRSQRDVGPDHSREITIPNSSTMGPDSRRGNPSHASNFKPESSTTTTSPGTFGPKATSTFVSAIPSSPQAVLLEGPRKLTPSQAMNAYPDDVSTPTFPGDSDDGSQHHFNYTSTTSPSTLLEMNILETSGEGGSEHTGGFELSSEHDDDFLDELELGPSQGGSSAPNPCVYCQYCHEPLEVRVGKCSSMLI